MKISKLVFVMTFMAVLLFAGCKPKIDPGFGSGSGSNPTPSAPADPVDPNDPFATQSKGSRAKSLDFIFNNMTLGTTTLKMRRSEWNQMLRNFDYFYKNENLVKVENYTYEKDGKTWNLENCGIRLRGNTSRYKPQGKTYPTDETGHKMPNADWSEGFYNYAATCSDDDYRQAHFKVDFEPDEGQEQKMAGCMKGVALKRNDSSYTRELLCYDIFRKNGIWTAPRASHTRVLFQFIEDLTNDGKRKEDISECPVTNVDFGVYEMFEEVNKQSLKARDSDEITGKSVWKNSKGDLWKCAGGNLADPNSSMYAEDIRITDFDETKEPKEPKSYIWDAPTYDLKSNKDQVDRASEYFRGFIRELKALKDITKGTEAGTKARKDFYEKWFDVDLFIKTYAINVSVGMDDDYWGNANNYYLYFDNSEKGTQKCYLIPFDYDNTIGNSIKGTGAENNVFDWGQGADRPLMDRLLEVPEYYQKYKNYLLSVTEFDNEKCPSNNARVKQMFEHWQKLVEPYHCPDDLLHPGDTSPSALWLEDSGGYNATRYYLSHEPYYFEQMHKNIISWGKDLPTEITFNLNGGNINGKTEDVKVTNVSFRQKLIEFGIIPERKDYVFIGWTLEKDSSNLSEYNTDGYVYAKWSKLSEIKDLRIYELKPGMAGYDEDYKGLQIGILNVPSGKAAIRDAYINGQRIYNKGFSSNENGIVVPEEVLSNVWRYPYVKEGETYSVQISYSTSSYSKFAETNTIALTAKSGAGEFVLSNKPEYKMVKDCLVFSELPKIKINDQIFEGGHYVLELTTDSWDYQSWNWVDFNKLNGFCLNDKVKDGIKPGKKLKFSLRFVLNSDDRYFIYIYDESQTVFTLETEPPRIILSTDPSYEGIIVTMPERSDGTYIRRIYINDKMVSDIRSYTNGEKALVLADEWRYPYTKSGNKYKVRVEYLTENWNKINEFTSEITATSGLGENIVRRAGEYQVDSNVLTWTVQPQIEWAGTLVSEVYKPGYYYKDFNDRNWNWYGSKKEYSYELKSYNVYNYIDEHHQDKKGAMLLRKDLWINLSYRVGNNGNLEEWPYGQYILEVPSSCTSYNFEIFDEE